MSCDWEIFHAGGVAADEVLHKLYRVDVAKALDPLNPKDYERLVRSLALELQGHAVPVEENALKQALQVLDVDWKNLKAPQRHKVVDLAQSYLGPPVVAQVLPKIEQTLQYKTTDLVRTSKAKTVQKYDLKIEPSLNAQDARTIQLVTKSQAHFIRDQYGQRSEKFGAQVRGIIANGMSKGFSSDDISASIHSAMSGTEVQRTRAYYTMVAMVVSNRARTMTQVASYGEAGIAFYLWESVLDEATSHQCRFLHGRRFPVKRAMQSIQEVEDSPDPEMVKTLQPFLNFSGDQIYHGSGESRVNVATVVESGVGVRDKIGTYSNAMSDEALQAAGVQFPPAHGHCRSLIVPEFGVISPRPAPMPTPPPVIDLQPKPTEVVQPKPVGTDMSLIAAHDEAMFAGKSDDELLEMQMAAQRSLKPVPKNRDEYKTPFGKKQFVADAPSLPALDQYDERTPLERFRAYQYRGGGLSREDRISLPVQRVLLDDFVSCKATLDKEGVASSLSKILKGRGKLSETDLYGGAPVLYRVDGKLYAGFDAYSEDHMAAAKALGMKSLNVKVVDLQHLIDENRTNPKSLAEIARRLDEEVARRTEKAIQDRKAKEATGHPDVVKIRAKYDPETYAREFDGVYHEAARAVGWGRAMYERGLDFPIDHALQTVRSVAAGVEEHPLNSLVAYLEKAQRSGSTTLRAFGMNSNEDVTSCKGAAALVGHLDAIVPHQHGAVAVVEQTGGNAANRRRAGSALNWLSDMTDRSVMFPKVKVRLKRGERASCSPPTDGAVTNTLHKFDSVSTIHHELAHGIEFTDRLRAIRASAFLDARCANEAPWSLAEFYRRQGRRSSYGASEVASHDQFRNPYIGKFYGRSPRTNDLSRAPGSFVGQKRQFASKPETEQIHRATEVTSMAVQEIGNWATVMGTDPDHFLFGLGQLGSI